MKLSLFYIFKQSLLSRNILEDCFNLYLLSVIHTVWIHDYYYRSQRYTNLTRNLIHFARIWQNINIGKFLTSKLLLVKYTLANVSVYKSICQESHYQMYFRQCFISTLTKNFIVVWNKTINRKLFTKLKHVYIICIHNLRSYICILLQSELFSRLIFKCFTYAVLLIC